MRVHDWLSKSHEGLYTQTGLTFGYLLLTDNRERMGFGATSPEGQWLDGEVVPKWVSFKGAYDAWLDPAERSASKTLKLTEAEEAFVPFYRKLYAALKNGLFITDDDLIHMGFPARTSGPRHPAPVAKEAPDSDADTSVRGRVTVSFFDRGGKHKKGKPDGQHCVEIAWVLSDVPVSRWDGLTHSTVDTNSPLTLAFENDVRGKTMYYALRWENTRGEKGPWSEILNVVVP
ncbi:MAG: hypothetical protein LBH72_04530 [Proteiniphilum sp.]|nr:hypothetical protein [Proteiniphilum sp.]